jgi:RNA polymerase sigma-70 factor (ECF subfamily)
MMPRLCNFVFHYLHSRDEALDVVHDVFARLWYTRSSLRLSGSITAYLYTASRNLALNRLRHTNVATAWITDTLSAPDTESSVPPDELLEAAERRAGIARAIAELPERQRTVCLLRWTHGLSYTQIAQQLGISEKTVDAQLQRAIRTIRAKVTGL